MIFWIEFTLFPIEKDTRNPQNIMIVKIQTEIIKMEILSGNNENM